MRQIILSLFISVAIAAGAQGAPVPVISLTPSGQLAGAPGSTVGWGFDLSYSGPADWVVLTGSEFTGPAVYGNYIDYLSLGTAPLYVAGPSPESATVSQSWNMAQQLGLGEFDISSTAAGGASVNGDIVVHYSVFSEDPNSPSFDPDTATVIADATISLPASVTITPEPAYDVLIGVGVLPVLFWRRRRKPAL